MNNNNNEGESQLTYKERALISRQRFEGTGGHEYIQFKTNTARVFGGIKEALLITQLHFLCDKGGDPEGWIYKNATDIEKETFLTRREQGHIRKKFVSIGVLQEVNRRVDGYKAPTMHYQIDFDVFDKIMSGELILCTKCNILNVPEVHSECTKCQKHLYTEYNTEYNTEVNQTSSTPVDNKPEPPKYSDKDLELSKLLCKLIKQNTPIWKPPDDIGKWAEHIEKLHRIDKRSYEDIEVMIRWTQQDNYWKQNILSTNKLRMKFNQLTPKVQATLIKSQRPVKPKVL